MEVFWHGGYRCTVRACLPERRIIVRHVVALFCQYLGEIKGGVRVEEYSWEYQAMRWGSALFLSPLFSLKSHRLRNLISSLLIEKYVLSMSKCFCGNSL